MRPMGKVVKLDKKKLGVRPCSGQCIVRRVDPDNMSAGGLHLPTSALEALKYERGVVLAVGSDQLHQSGEYLKPECDVGSVVLFFKTGRPSVEINGEQLIILNFSEILAVCE